MIKKLQMQKINLKRQKKVDDEDEEEKQLFSNPLLAFAQKKEKTENKTEKGDHDEWSDDDKYDPK